MPLQIDVFTLVPHAFAWLTEQRPLSAVLGGELELRLLNYRDWTPLRAGQVDPPCPGTPRGPDQPRDRQGSVRGRVGEEVEDIRWADDVGAERECDRDPNDERQWKPQQPLMGWTGAGRGAHAFA